MIIEQLAYSPAIQDDETLWSWITRVALYHGWSADEFLRLLGLGALARSDHFRQVDVDCAMPESLLDRLAAVTGFDRRVLAAHQVTPSLSTLWLDDRVAFCESCWTEVVANAVPYVRRSWLDAWCIDCPLHSKPLVTIKKVYRPRQGADWNAAWASRADWAQRTNALCTPSTTELFGCGPSVIVRRSRETQAADRLTTIRPRRGLPHYPKRMRSGWFCWQAEDGTSSLLYARSSIFERGLPGATAHRVTMRGSQSSNLSGLSSFGPVQFVSDAPWPTSCWRGPTASPISRTHCDAGSAIYTASPADSCRPRFSRGALLSEFAGSECSNGAMSSSGRSQRW
jgi:TniQ